MTDVVEFAATPSYEDAYRKLRIAYVERLKNSVESIDHILAQKEMGTLSRDTLQRAMHLAHGLAGSGTTFGFPEITTAGQKIDMFLVRAFKTMGAEDALNEKNYQTYESMMMILRHACQDALQQDDDDEGVIAPPQVKSEAATSKNDFMVLIVDDDNNLADLLSIRLRQKNIRVMNASDGETALKIIKHDAPDLVVLDINLPGMSGHDILRRLKQDPEHVAMPVLMLTANAQEKDVVSALHSGAIDYIIKPVDADQLVARVEKLLDASRYTVIIADNDPLILQLLESKFRHRGFKVRLAEDGNKAWTQISKSLPDLVILDRMMPGKEGLSVLQEMRDEEATRNIPVIILSARKEDRDINEGLKRGAQDYMVKPFIVDDLINKSLKLLKEADFLH